MPDQNLSQEQAAIKNRLNFLSVGAGAVAALIVGALAVINRYSVRL